MFCCLVHKYPDRYVDPIITKDISRVTPKNDILDWESCLQLSGGKAVLAKTMAAGLLDEAEAILPLLLNCKDAEELLEPVHKLHGLCKYVGAARLLNTLGEAETQLKTNNNDWKAITLELSETIKELLQFCLENPNWSEVEGSL